MNRVSALGILMSGILFLIVGNFGYVAFGDDIKESILDNIANASGASDFIAKLCIVITAIMSYPLLFLEYKNNMKNIIIEFLQL